MKYLKALSSFGHTKFQGTLNLESSFPKTILLSPLPPAVLWNFLLSICASLGEGSWENRAWINPLFAWRLVWSLTFGTDYPTLLPWAHWLTVSSVHLILRAPNSPRTASGSPSRWFRCLLLSIMTDSFTISVYDVKCFITRGECEAIFLKPKWSWIINADVPCVV